MGHVLQGTQQEELFPHRTTLLRLSTGGEGHGEDQMKDHHPSRVCWEGAGLARNVEHDEQTRRVIQRFYPYHTIRGYTNTLKKKLNWGPEVFFFFFLYFFFFFFPFPPSSFSEDWLTGRADGLKQDCRAFRQLAISLTGNAQEWGCYCSWTSMF